MVDLKLSDACEIARASAIKQLGDCVIIFGAGKQHETHPLRGT